eukprot:g6128.t1
MEIKTEEIIKFFGLTITTHVLLYKHKRILAERRTKNAMRRAKNPDVIFALSPKEAKRERQKSQALPLRLVIDCTFDDIANHSPQEMRSLGNQIRFLYGDARRCIKPSKIFVCGKFGSGYDPNAIHVRRPKKKSFQGGKSHLDLISDKEIFLKSEKSIEELEICSNPSQVIYLSPNAPQVLSEVDSSKTYIMGGIIDRTIKKECSLKRAKELGFETARLPIRHAIGKKIETVLNLNIVGRILLLCNENGGDKKSLYSAIKKCIPIRVKKSK